MTQKSMSVLARIIIIMFALLGVVLFGFAVPLFGADVVADNPEFSSWYAPWLVFIELMLFPCYAVLVLAWRITSTIRAGKAFCMRNSVRFKAASLLALITSAYFFAGNIVFGLLNMSHPGVMLAALVVVFIGFAISAAAAILSCMVRNAAMLQEESDLTI